MGYVSLGSIGTDSFNSTKYPGVCKPSNVATLAVFKRLQTQLNRVASVKGIPTIAVDGDIGAGTLGVFGKLQAQLAVYAASKADTSAAIIPFVSASDCKAVASQADLIADVADGYADSLNAPASPPAPKPAKPPMLVSPTGVETAPPIGASLLSSFESAPTIMKIGLVGVVGGIAYVTLKKKRRRR